MTDDDKSVDEVVDEEDLKVETEQPVLTDESPDEDPDNTEDPEKYLEEAPKPRSAFQKFWCKYKSKKKITFPLTFLLFLAVLLAVPTTRYALLGTFVKREVQFRIIDNKTNIPVSGAEISLQNQTAKTDGEGKASIKGVKVGKAHAAATKKYYKDAAQDFIISPSPAKSAGAIQISLQATGRQVPIHIVNKISGKSVAGAAVKVSDTEVQTDKNGEATLVLPAERSEESGSITTTGYNKQTIKITISESAVKENTFAVTPVGKLYFLSKLTGKIDVVKTDLDGSNRSTVLAGTGKEEDRGTVLLATRDWKYLALQSRREDDKARLYLIDTTNDKLTEIDSGDATFTPVGWDGHLFAYKVIRNNLKPWQSKNTALKVYSAESLQLTTVDETSGEGSDYGDYAGENLDSIYIAKNNLVYVKSWRAGYSSAYRLAGKQTGIYSARTNGTGKETIKSFDAGAAGFISAVSSEPGEIYFSVANNTINSSNYYAYKDGKVSEDKDIKAEDFTKSYPTYLQSPSGQNTFWYEPRDGKNTLFIGTPDGANGKQIASLSEYTGYGWYSDDYLLVSKSGSELYILPKEGPGDKNQVLKVTDYHKPDVSFPGYGGGYGGI